jgi:hypothetical protein
MDKFFKNAFFKPLEFELKYRFALGVLGTIAGWLSALSFLQNTWGQVALFVSFGILTLLIYGHMIRRLKEESTVKKGYLLYVKVRFWSTVIVALMLISMFSRLHYLGIIK